jgi:hypothetical protein
MLLTWEERGIKPYQVAWHKWACENKDELNKTVHARLLQPRTPLWSLRYKIPCDPQPDVLPHAAKSDAVGRTCPRCSALLGYARSQLRVHAWWRWLRL